MITCDDAIIEKMILHKVGNKVNNEPLKLSQSEFALHGEISNILIKYFTNGFRSPITYRLVGESGIEGNRVGKAAKAYLKTMENYTLRAWRLQSIFTRFRNIRISNRENCMLCC